MGSERPICGDRRKEAELARRLAAGTDDPAIASALLRYAEDQELEWQRELSGRPSLDSGPLVI
jgi:hypothetical protein